MSARAPVFAVVGHVNRGKSSIVSTLAADESVGIGSDPGTTRVNREYSMRVADETLYTLVDTPGFERARAMLAWLRERDPGPGGRPALVERFVAEHAGSDRFAQECELLRPVLQGAAILYVIDSSLPVSAAAEAEIEILRWTARPRMALLNPIGEAEHADTWRPVLEQSFSLVRVFDAQQADLTARVELLRALRELAEAWRARLDRAIELLIADRAASVRECAGLIADALAELLGTQVERKLSGDESIETLREPLLQALLERLRAREQRLRGDLRRVYLHASLEVVQEGIDEVGEDLFAVSTWSRLGLSRAQLALGGAAAGALAGGSVDVALVGSSLLAGAAIGGVLGLASSLWAWKQLASVRLLGAPLGGERLLAGPVRDPGFGWVVLDRALILHAAVAQRAHARRRPLDLAGCGSRVRDLDGETRARISKPLERLRRDPGEAERDAARQALAAEIEPLLREGEPALSPASSPPPAPV